MTQTRTALNNTDRAILRAYAGGKNVADIAAEHGMKNDTVGFLLLRLCNLNRTRAAEVVRAGTLGPARSESAPASAPSPVPLRPREIQVIRLAAEGHTNAAIAETVNVKVSTIAACLRDAYAKLGVSSRTDAIRVATEQGYLADTPEPTAEPPAAAEAPPAPTADEPTEDSPNPAGAPPQQAAPADTEPDFSLQAALDAIAADGPDPQPHDTTPAPPTGPPTDDAFQRPFVIAEYGSRHCRACGTLAPAPTCCHTPTTAVLIRVLEPASTR